MKPTAFISNLGKGSIPLLVVCSGEELFFKEEVLQHLRRTIEADHPDLQIIFWETQPGEKEPAELNRLLGEMQTLGLFSPRKLIVARDAKNLLKAGAKALAELLESAPEGNTLCFFADSLDGRTRLAKRLKKEGAFVECKRLYSQQFFIRDSSRGAAGLSELGKWALARARGHGLQLDPDAAGFLVSLTGNNLFVIDSELEKLKLCFAGESSVAVRDIEESTGMSALHTPFDLWEQMEQGRVADALSTLGVILRNGMRSQGGKLVTDDPGIAAILLSIFRSRIRLAAATATLKLEKKRDEEIQAEIGVGHPFAYGKIKQYAATLNGPKYLELHGAILSAERRIKRMSQHARAVIEETVIRIARANKGR